MRIFGKSLVEYWQSSKKFLLLSFLLMFVISGARLFLNYSSGILDLFLAFFILIWAGWVVVRKSGFALKQTAVVGVMISLTTVWALPIFDPISQIPSIIIVNGIIYALVAVIGGASAKIFKKLQVTAITHGKKK